MSLSLKKVSFPPLPEWKYCFIFFHDSPISSSPVGIGDGPRGAILLYLRASAFKFGNTYFRGNTYFQLTSLLRSSINGLVEKEPLMWENYNLALTYATQDLKHNWQKYRKEFEEEINERK